jgi:hypothetical protein
LDAVLFAIGAAVKRLVPSVADGQSFSLWTDASMVRPRRAQAAKKRLGLGGSQHGHG